VKNIFNVLGFLKWIRYIHIVRDLYNKVENYNLRKGNIVNKLKDNFGDIYFNDLIAKSLKI
jgi:hypothetical protein